MKIKVLLFGILAEKAGLEEIEVEKINSINELTKNLTGRYPSFADYKFRVAVNQVLVNKDKRLKEGDVVALLPPFAGG